MRGFVWAVLAAAVAFPCRAQDLSSETVAIQRACPPENFKTAVGLFQCQDSLGRVVWLRYLPETITDFDAAARARAQAGADFDQGRTSAGFLMQRVRYIQEDLEAAVLKRRDEASQRLIARSGAEQRAPAAKSAQDDICRNKGFLVAAISALAGSRTAGLEAGADTIADCRGVPRPYRPPVVTTTCSTNLGVTTCTSR